MAERGRTRAFADLLVERQTGQQESDPYTPVTVEHILDTVNSQRALVLYFSMAAGYLYSWLLAPGAGKLISCDFSRRIIHGNVHDVVMTCHTQTK